MNSTWSRRSLRSVRAKHCFTCSRASQRLSAAEGFRLVVFLEAGLDAYASIKISSAAVQRPFSLIHASSSVFQTRPGRRNVAQRPGPAISLFSALAGLQVGGADYLPEKPARSTAEVVAGVVLGVGSQAGAGFRIQGRRAQHSTSVLGSGREASGPCRAT